MQLALVELDLEGAAVEGADEDGDHLVLLREGVAELAAPDRQLPVFIFVESILSSPGSRPSVGSGGTMLEGGGVGAGGRLAGRGRA